MSLARIRTNLRYVGLRKTAYRSAYMAFNEVGVLRIYECMTLSADDINPEHVPAEAPFRCRFLTREEMRDLARIPENNLPENFLGPALHNNDDCMGIFDGETLASFGWYSSRPTLLLHSLLVHFDDRYVYMYRGFTKPEYRGKRLHSLGLARAVSEYAGRGKTGLVALAEKVNYASKRSAFGMGFRQFGTVYQLGTRRHYFLWHSEGCARYGFRITKGTLACAAP